MLDDTSTSGCYVCPGPYFALRGCGGGAEAGTKRESEETSKSCGGAKVVRERLPKDHRRAYVESVAGLSFHFESAEARELDLPSTASAW